MTSPFPFNVVMVTLDCVRPDHLGCYGYGGVETPHLDGLAAKGALFEQAVTHAPNTWVAHATLFTGCLPPRHGLRAATHKISQETVTLAEWLGGYGYATAAFPGTSLVGRAHGFHRGFDHFDDGWTSAGLQIKEVSWRRGWADARQRAWTWAKAQTRPFFLWLHYMDTHHLPGCDLPEYHRKRFSPRWQWYDGKISHADQVCVGPLLGFLEESGLLDRTLVALFSDHGEELPEDDRPVHDGGLRDDVIRVPLILSLPQGTGRPGLRVPLQVRMVDLLPTVCDVLGLPHPVAIQGHSLVSLLKGLPDDGGNGRWAYLENWPRGYIGVRTPEWKLILRHPETDRGFAPGWVLEGLFHHLTDPREQVNLSLKNPATVERLRDYCLSTGIGERPQGMDAQERAGIERALRGLGYL